MTAIKHKRRGPKIKPKSKHKKRVLYTLDKETIKKLDYISTKIAKATESHKNNSNTICLLIEAKYEEILNRKRAKKLERENRRESEKSSE